MPARLANSYLASSDLNIWLFAQAEFLSSSAVTRTTRTTDAYLDFSSFHYKHQSLLLTTIRYISINTVKELKIIGMHKSTGCVSRSLLEVKIILGVSLAS